MWLTISRLCQPRGSLGDRHFELCDVRSSARLPACTSFSFLFCSLAQTHASKLARKRRVSMNYRVISLNCPLRLSFYSETMSSRIKCKSFLSHKLLDFLLSALNSLPVLRVDISNICYGRAPFLKKSVILEENS